MGSQIKDHKIRQYRNRKGMTVRELAEAVGVSHQAVVYWETPNPKWRLNPKPSHRLKLCEVFECEMEDLFTFSG